MPFGRRQLRRPPKTPVKQQENKRWEWDVLGSRAVVVEGLHLACGDCAARGLEIDLERRGDAVRDFGVGLDRALRGVEWVDEWGS